MKKPSAGVVPPASGSAVTAKPPSTESLSIKIPGPGEIKILSQSSSSIVERTEATGGLVDIQSGKVIALNDDCSLVSSGALIIHNFEKFASVEVQVPSCLSFFVALRLGLGLSVADVIKKFSELKNCASQDVVDSIKKLEVTMNANKANIYVSDDICKSFYFLRVYFH